MSKCKACDKKIRIYGVHAEGYHLWTVECSCTAVEDPLLRSAIDRHYQLIRRCQGALDVEYPVNIQPTKRERSQL